MKLIKLILTLLIFNSSPLYAIIINNGNFTTDTSTDLDWLDVTETKGLSANHVYTSYISSGEWRFATGNELNQLISNYTGSVIDNYNRIEQPDHRIDGLIDFLGATVTSGIEVFDNGTATLGLIEDFTFGTVGCTVSPSGSLDCSAPQKNWVAQLLHFDIDSIELAFGDEPAQTFTLIDSTKTHNLLVNIEDSSEDIGSFLIRDHQPPIPSVPLPSAIWLLVSGLFAMFTFFHRKS